MEKSIIVKAIAANRIYLKLREISNTINEKLNEVSYVFNQFQENSGLKCPTGCGKCCMKADISCSPYELLPMAFHLIDSKRAEEVLEKAKNHSNKNCLFLDVKSEYHGTGQCHEYQYRPFICRAFGLSARIGKHQNIERSVCSILRKIEIDSPNIQIVDNEIPLIDLWKKKLEIIDPHLLDKEIPIHQGIVILLEKLLLLEKMHDQSI